MHVVLWRDVITKHNSLYLTNTYQIHLDVSVKLLHVPKTANSKVVVPC